VRISIPVFKGWFLLRMSLHEPLMPLMIESDLEGGVNSILNEIKPFLEMYPDLELPF
jgi:phosphomannomutase